MPHPVPVSPEEFSDKSWKRPAGLMHAAKDPIVAISLSELSQAALAFPLCFVKSAESFTLVALQSLQKDKNLFVSPDGRWLTHYIPLAYQLYPFRLANTEDGQLVLCFDSDSGCLVDGAEKEEPFFDASNNLSETVKSIFDALATSASGNERLNEIISFMDECGLITPWEISLGDQHKLAGVYKVDEKAFNALANETYLELREMGAITLVYCQLLSMLHLADLVSLAQSHAELGQAPAGMDQSELNLDLIDEGGTIDLSNI